MRIIDKLFSSIIRQLLETNDYINTAELAKSVGISESTIKHNLNYIELELGKEGLSLSRRRGKGIALIASDSQRKEMQKTLEYHHNYTIQLFSEELCVSKNVIIKDLESLKDMLSQMHLTLSIKRNNGVAISGNEFYMRQMIIINNNERHLTEQYLEPPVHVDCRISKRAYKYFNTCYRYMDFDLILRQVKQAEKNLCIHFTDISLGRVMEYVAISVQRIKNGLVLSQIHKDGLPRPPAPYLKEAGRLLFELLAGRRFARETECLYLGARLYAAKTSSMKSSQLTKEFEIEAAEFVERVGSVVMDMELACDRGLIPGTEAYEAALEKGAGFAGALAAMKAAAEEGWRATEGMVAKIGRASRLGERSRGVLDAGATSCYLILSSMADTVQQLISA